MCMNKKCIVVIDYFSQDRVPTGKDIFYLCLNCRSIIQSLKTLYMPDNQRKIGIEHFAHIKVW